MKQPKSKTRCPGCHRLIGVIEPPVKNFDLTYNPELRKELLDGRINQAFCSSCKKVFRCETELLVFHEKHKYAILAAAREHGDVIRGKSLLFSLFGHTQFRFRVVRYCIEAIEKVRIFEDGLDDRAVEWMKYQFCPPQVKSAQNQNLLLYTGISDNTLSFCVFDDFDEPTDAKFFVPSEKYQQYTTRCKPELLDNPNIRWKRIDSNWAAMTIDSMG